MSARAELGRGWRGFASATLGLVAGTIPLYTNNIFAPALIAEFGWSRSQFALIGLAVVSSVIGLPITGRVIDRVGVRRVSTIGVVAMPVVFLAMATMRGDFHIFLALSVAQLLIMSCLVGILTYTRIITLQFKRMLGLALGIACAAPACVAIVATPALTALVAAQGWRAGYVAMAVATALVGGTALALMPPVVDRETDAVKARSPAVADYRAIFRGAPFLLILAALLLCNLHFSIQTTQLKLLTKDRGMTDGVATFAISLFATGALAGRLVCGVALDRLPAPLVATICFGVPGASVAILAGAPRSDGLLTAAIIGMGLSLGAEGDLVAYLTDRYMPRRLYGSVLGLFTGAMAVSALIGTLLLSASLRQTGGYTAFLLIAAAATFVGCALMLALPLCAAVEEPTASAPALELLP